MQRRLIGELGRPSRTRDRGRWKRSMSWYKATPKSRAVRRESERVVVLRTSETTQLGARKGPALR
jgi:hypothetical protein